MLAEVKAEQDATAQEEKIELTLEVLQEAWRTYAAQEEGLSASYRSFLKKAEISLEGEAVTATVSSDLAQSNIQQDRKILDALRRALRTPGLILTTLIDESKKAKAPPKPKRMLTDKEKYLSMRDTNPLLQEMQRRFDLRPD